MDQGNLRDGEIPAEHNKYKCALCLYSTRILQYYKQHMITHSNEKPFKCPKCPYRSKWKANVKQHLKHVHTFPSPTESGSEASRPFPFPCPHSGCSYAGKQKSALNLHSKIHSGETAEFSCSHPNCNYSSNYKGNLGRHTKIHSRAGQKPFACQFESCSYAALTLAILQHHLRIHIKEKPYKCPEANCEYSAAQKSNLKRHGLTHAPEEGKERPSFPCPLCKYSGKTKFDLSAHIKRHTFEKLFKCDETNCDFEALTKAQVRRHKPVHSKLKPFVCSVESCDHRCKWKHSLSTHSKSHSEERRYKCGLCPYRGKTRQVVCTHLKHVHSDLEFRRFKCTEPQCNYVAKAKNCLKQHLLTHKQQQSSMYACSFPQCDYRANEKSNVKRHQNYVHSLEKKVKCRICDRQFKGKPNLTSHIRTHTMEEPYFCKENGCTYSAKTASALNQHQKKYHTLIFTHGKRI